MDNHISIDHIILINKNHIMANLPHVQYPRSYYGQSPACLVPKWSDFWSHNWSKIFPILIQYGRILLQNGRIWFQKWSTKVKKHIFPEMSQNGLEMVPIASGGPGNRFLQYNNTFLYYKTELCFLLFITPIPLLNSLSWAC